MQYREKNSVEEREMEVINDDKLEPVLTCSFQEYQVLITYLLRTILFLIACHICVTKWFERTLFYLDNRFYLLLAIFVSQLQLLLFDFPKNLQDARVNHFLIFNEH